jgi:hypothetical protein
MLDKTIAAGSPLQGREIAFHPESSIQYPPLPPPAPDQMHVQVEDHLPAARSTLTNSR